MPMAAFTFLEYFDFTGKTIKPLCTHEGSGMGSSINDIKRLWPGALVEPGLAMRGGDVKRAEEEIKNWIKGGKSYKSIVNEWKPLTLWQNSCKRQANASLMTF